MSNKKEPPENITEICDECGQERLQKWQEENKDTIIEKGDFVKIPFIQEIDGKKKTEWMWCVVNKISKNQQVIIGILDNDPMYVTDVKCGNKYRFGRNQICQLLKEENDE